MQGNTFITNIGKDFIELNNIKYDLEDAVIKNMEQYNGMYKVGSQVKSINIDDTTGKIKAIRLLQGVIKKQEYNKAKNIEMTKSQESKNYYSAYAKDIVIALINAGVIKDSDKAFDIWNHKTIEHINSIKEL